MRLLPAALLATLLLTASSPWSLAQNHKRSSALKPRGASHHQSSPDLMPNVRSKGGAADELTKIEHQPLAQSSATSARPKPVPQTLALPKLDSERKTGKSGAIKVSGGHSQKGMSSTHRSSGAAAPRIH